MSGRSASRSDSGQDASQSGRPSQLAAGDVANYEKIGCIGEGTYGVVYRARDRRTGEVVALKRVRMAREMDGMPVTALRELMVLQGIRHPNLVQLKEVVTGKGVDSIFLVFEYVEHDLARLLDTMKAPFSESEIKCLLRQLLEAIAHLHSHWVMHRDLKLPNMLFNNQGELKLCDFGLARYFSHKQDAKYTPKVVTLWYRAPELLLGQETYTEAIDMWAVGCVMAELLRTDPLFPGKSELHMLELMTTVLGSMNDRIWPGFSRLPNARTLEKTAVQPYSYLRHEFPGLSDNGIDFLNKLLTYDPRRRMTAEEALQHPYFREKPYPKAKRLMPTFPSTTWETKLPGGNGGGGGRAEGGGGGGGGSAAAAAAAVAGGGRGLAKRVQDERFGEMFGGGGGGAAKKKRLA